MPLVRFWGRWRQYILLKTSNDTKSVRPNHLLFLFWERECRFLEGGGLKSASSRLHSCMKNQPPLVPAYLWQGPD